MTKVTQFPTQSESRESLQEKSSLWVSRMDRGLSTSEQQELVAWINQDKKHQEMLFKIATLWDDLSVLNELSGLFPLEKKPKAKSLGFVKLAMAASLVLVSIFGGGLYLTLDPVLMNGSNSSIARVNTFKTTIGQQSSYSLPDGSSIQLNTNSQVDIVFTGKRRQLTLVKGEARFDVAKDKNRPFTVTAGEQSFTALGTIFNIQKDNNKDMELVVTEGRVLITKANEVIDKISANIINVTESNLPGTLVVSGEKAVIEESTQSQVQQISLDQVQRDLAWQQGMLIFDGEPLEKALIEVSRYSNTQFRIIDPQLANIKVAGYFKAGDIDGLLQSLNSNFKINYKKQSNNSIALSTSSL